MRAKRAFRELFIKICLFLYRAMKSVKKRELICLSRLHQRYNDIFVKVMLDSATMLQSYAALVLHYGLYKRREQKNDRCALWKSQSYKKWNWEASNG